MQEYHFTVEPATPDAIAPYGRFVGTHADVPVFAEWQGTRVNGPVPLELGTGGEMLLITTAAKPFPAQSGLIERHFKHTQAYIPANGKPFVMLLGAATEGDVPDYAGLRAFLFDGDSGIVLDTDIWHDFPYAIEDDTRFIALLRQEAHVNTNDSPAHEMDADGPDLQRRAMRPRATLIIDMPR